MDAINELFAEAREEIKDATDEAETVLCTVVNLPDNPVVLFLQTPRVCVVLEVELASMNVGNVNCTCYGAVGSQAHPMAAAYACGN